MFEDLIIDQKCEYDPAYHENCPVFAKDCTLKSEFDFICFHYILYDGKCSRKVNNET
jgi:hypothetical protein